MDIQHLENKELVNMYIYALSTVKNRIKICDSHNGVGKERDMSWSWKVMKRGAQYEWK